MGSDETHEQGGPIEGRWERENVAAGGRGYTRTTVYVERACLPYVAAPGQRRRCSENRGGDFYTDCETCLVCDVPHQSAPDLMAYVEHPEGGCHCNFTRQPRTPEEIDKAIDAMCDSDLCAIRYGGSDPSILRRIRQRGPWATAATDAAVPRAWLTRRKALFLALIAAGIAAAVVLALGGAG